MIDKYIKYVREKYDSVICQTIKEIEMKDNIKEKI